MRKALTALAMSALMGLAVITSAATAQADPAGTFSVACDNAWRGATSGDFYAYSESNCSGFMGKAEGNDSDWGNSAGPFQGSDTNRASSILHKGTSGLAVAVYNGTGTDWGGGYTCLRKGELYASYLGDNSFTSGAGVDNGISSHRWAPESDCRGHFVT
ncbi:hypothetical protein F4560_003062 [Saccharothrix ecbatanensis]|uniref:Peptidase inhibitor family I36 n=1 Tax=Saccharothrix ecbatanensis TaxID=1105145 RepID=A0A7W9M0U4_9PSEU|nr:hypothetical protein [Saccharothrix ecbatanensis]MBB5803294.1 hypothetical protein [Saccharothrix ecbatanensis]